ncbi:unnamed protein product [Paramecium octaurelia]|uniref:Uncharacterized protein n=1 Tax=Paramecium octaurelia TaxID=43137 RepID=A0A8S1S467_PAROT|nr:unnamed protein product [Paramecium octaurelia]
MVGAGFLNLHTLHSNCTQKYTQYFSFGIHNSVLSNYVIRLMKITFIFYNCIHQTQLKTLKREQILVICLNNYNIHNLIYILNYWHCRHNSFECIQIYDTCNRYQMFQKLIIIHDHLF